MQSVLDKFFRSIPEVIAAIDLGSNSFHMLVAKHQDGNLIVIDQLREMVRLAAGLDKNNYLSEEASQRALDCLARFGQRLKDVEPRGIRIVGTNTLRKAENSAEFLDAAEELLGHPIEIISGIEEARLIYLGVSHTVAGDNGQRLVIDIGGGSTEMTLGERFEPSYMQSLYMGCVSMSQAYFNNGKISEKKLRKAELAALIELEPHVEQYKKLGWVDAIGASGTIKAVNKVVNAMGWSTDGISHDAMNQLVDALKQVSHIDELTLSGLKPERRPVFAGGVMVLKALFDALDIEFMKVSDGALREGLLYDLIGRGEHKNTRAKTVAILASRYHVDEAHAERVENTSLDFLQQVADNWELPGEDAALYLAWASRLHEIGLSISFSQFHKHGAYILTNADMLGFSRQDQQILAALVRAHRRSLSKDLFKSLPDEWEQKGLCLAILLRLSVLLHRSRHVDALPDIKLVTTNTQLQMQFPEGWLEQHPLTQADLEQEAAILESAGITFSYQ